MNHFDLMRIVLLGATCLWTSSTSFGAMRAEEAELSNFDKRRDGAVPTQRSSADRQTAAERLKVRIPGVRIDLDDVLAAPKFVYNAEGFLTGPDSEDEIFNPRTAQSLAVQQAVPPDPHRRIKRFLDENAALFGHGADILIPARISREYITEHNQLRTVVWEQQLDGIPVFDAVLYGHLTRKVNW